MRAKLTNEVSISELMEYRRENFTNAEIAEMLGVSVATIYRLIGPSGIRKKREKKPKDEGNIVSLPSAPAKEPEDVPPACMVTLSRIVEVGNDERSYRLNTETQTVEIRAHGGCLSVDYKDLPGIAKEIAAILRKCGDSLVMFVEAW